MISKDSISFEAESKKQSLALLEFTEVRTADGRYNFLNTLMI